MKTWIPAVCKEFFVCNRVEVRVKAAGLICFVIEQRPRDYVTANEYVYSHVCIILGTSHHGEDLFAVCVSIRQGKICGCPPKATTYLTSKLSFIHSQEKRKTEPSLVSLHELRQQSVKISSEIVAWRETWQIDYGNFLRSF